MSLIILLVPPFVKNSSIHSFVEITKATNLKTRSYQQICHSFCISNNHSMMSQNRGLFHSCKSAIDYHFDLLVVILITINFFLALYIKIKCHWPITRATGIVHIFRIHDANNRIKCI